jgi:AraC-like DNA-binding protein
MTRRPPHKPLHRIGNATSEIIVQAQTCAALARHGIVVAGISNAAAPYHMSRLPAWHTEVLACFAGSGLQWVDHRWVLQTPGTVCVAPDGVTQAFQAVRGRRWGFAWIQYHPGKLPLPSREVSLAHADAEPLRASIALLHRELSAKADPAILTQLSDLLQMLVLRILGRHELDPRLTRVLEQVAGDLSHRWTLSDLAQTARVSNEQLRRLFQRYLGRSPLHRVLELRLARASELLRSTDHKVEAIAHEVGYSSLYAFSAAFARELGCSPSLFRQRSRPGAVPERSRDIRAPRRPLPAAPRDRRARADH